MPSKTIGFGVVGCGVIGPTHCDALKGVPDARLLAVCDTNPAQAQKLAQTYGVPFYTNLPDFLAHPGLDAVSICVPSGYHSQVGIEVAQAGKHLLVEKPIEVTLQAALRLIEACEKAGVRLGVISQHRFAKDVIKLKETIEAGKFGPMVLGEASIKWYRTQQYYDSGDWRGTKAIDGGGALMNQGVHYIDLLQWLMGSVESVTARVITRTHQIEVEDLAIAIVRFTNGALGSITGSTSIFPGLAERLEIHGRDATALIELDVLKTYYDRANLEEIGDYGRPAQIGQSETEISPGGASSPTAIGQTLHTAQVADFVAAIIEEHDPAITGRAALRPLEIILAIYRSAAENREVRIAEMAR